MSPWTRSAIIEVSRQLLVFYEICIYTKITGKMFKRKGTVKISLKSQNDFPSLKQTLHDINMVVHKYIKAFLKGL